jgi:predicted CoA-binding protein
MIYKYGSLILSPQVTLNVLKEAKELGVPALWIQPGAEDLAVADYIKENGLEDRVVYGGPCLLVQGDGVRQKL